MNVFLDEYHGQIFKEETARKIFKKIRWNGKWFCPSCGYKKKWNLKDDKFKCRNCGTQTTITSGTLLQGTHLSLNIWLKIIYHSTLTPNISISEDVWTACNVKSSKTKTNILRRIKIAKARDITYKLTGKIEIKIIESRHEIEAVEIRGKYIGKFNIWKYDDLTPENLKDIFQENLKPPCVLKVHELPNYIKVLKKSRKISRVNFDLKKVYVNLKETYCDKMEQMLQKYKKVESYFKDINNIDAIKIHNSIIADINFEEILNNFMKYKPITDKELENINMI